jgi:hypothetical protein
VGGTFCRFSAGRSGRSPDYLRYLLRASALGESPPGIWTRHLPDAITCTGPGASFTLDLMAYVWLQETREAGMQRDERARTHYRAMVSFERPLSEGQMGRLVNAWLEECFPRQPSIAVLHRNTTYRHIHIWIAARGGDGRQLNLSAAQYRQLDERWNRLYAPAVAQDECEHLRRKRAWEGRKRVFREALEKLRGPQSEAERRTGNNRAGKERNETQSALRKRREDRASSRERTGKVPDAHQGDERER